MASQTLSVGEKSGISHFPVHAVGSVSAVAWGLITSNVLSVSESNGFTGSNGQAVEVSEMEKIKTMLSN